MLKAALVVIFVTASMILSSPSRADAHGVGGIGPSNTTAKVTTIQPKSDDFKAESIENGNRFKITKTQSTDIVVLGVDEEQFLLFDNSGVFVNKKSATRLINQSNSTTKSVEALKREFEATSSDPNEKPVWEKLSSASSYAWHDHRSHYMGTVPKGITNLGTSQIKVKVDGEIHTITIEFNSRSSSFPYFLLIAFLIGLILVGATSYFFTNVFVRKYTQIPVTISLVAIIALESIHIFGYSVFSQRSMMSDLSSSLYGIILLLLAITSLIKVSKNRNLDWDSKTTKLAPLLSATGFVGLSAGALLEYKILVDPYLPTVFPAWIAKFSVITIGILSAAIFALGIANIKHPSNSEELLKEDLS